MTERMVEALEIEGKLHEVHWYDDEGHGWERRENRRDAFERILAFLKTPRPRRARGRPAGRRGIPRPAGEPADLPGIEEPSDGPGRLCDDLVAAIRPPDQDRGC